MASNKTPGRVRNETSAWLQLHLTPAPTLDDVPIAVQVVDRWMRSAWKGAISLGRAEKLLLPRPGRYSVQVNLPSGRIVSKDVQVPQDGVAVELDVFGSQSVRESAPGGMSETPAAYPQLRAIPGDTGKPNLPTGLAWSRLSRSGRFISAASANAASGALKSTWLRLWREREDGNWSLEPWPGGGASRVGDIAQYEFRLKQIPGEYYLQIGGEDLPWRLTALPADDLRVTLRGEWRKSGSGDDLSKPLIEPHRRVSVDVVTLEARAETLLAYLASGQFDEARNVSDRLIAENLLEMKRQNPTVAAIAGYYLLNARKLEGVHREWVANLADRWAWLPDGAVIDAWYLMRLPTPNLEKARSRLIEAVARGMPVYTRGLRLLLDGLAAFEDDTAFATPDVSQALRIVRRYCRTIDWGSLTASFLGVDPATPDRRQTGRPESSEHVVFIDPTDEDLAWVNTSQRRAATGARSALAAASFASALRPSDGDTSFADLGSTLPRALSPPPTSLPQNTGKILRSQTVPVPSSGVEGYATIASRDILTRLLRAVDQQTQSEQVASLAPIAVDVGNSKPARLRGVALERILGRSKLLSPLFLQRGLAASRTVGRLVTCSPDGLPGLMATGFLVSPRLLLTTAYILPDLMTASSSYVEFNYEDGPDGLLRRPDLVDLDPHAFFVRDEAADFALVALKDEGIGFRQGWCRLSADEIKAVRGERLSIVQHALGAPKQIALRELEIVQIGETFFRCAAFAATCSSGSPLFNDQWEVIGFCRTQVSPTDLIPEAAYGTSANHRSASKLQRGDVFEAVRASRVLRAIGQADLSPGARQLFEELQYANPPLEP